MGRWSQIENDPRTILQDRATQVRMRATRFISHLNNRIRAHDATMLREPEIGVYMQYMPRLRKIKYGSQEWEKVISDMGEAHKHHYKYNSHHPEHYENGVSGMNLLDLIEMYFDWFIEAEDNKQDRVEVIERLGGKYGLSDQIIDLFKNTIEIIR